MRPTYRQSQWEMKQELISLQLSAGSSTFLLWSTPRVQGLGSAGHLMETSILAECRKVQSTSWWKLERKVMASRCSLSSSYLQGAHLDYLGISESWYVILWGEHLLQKLSKSLHFSGVRSTLKRVPLLLRLKRKGLLTLTPGLKHLHPRMTEARYCPHARAEGGGTRLHCLPSSTLPFSPPLLSRAGETGNNYTGSPFTRSCCHLSVGSCQAPYKTVQSCYLLQQEMAPRNRCCVSFLGLP